MIDKPGLLALAPQIHAEMDAPKKVKEKKQETEPKKRENPCNKTIAKDSIVTFRKARPS